MFKTFSAALGITVLGLGLGLGLAQSAQAGTFHNGWNYSIDAFNDGSGGRRFEIQGLAFKETADAVLVSVTGGAALAGVNYGGAADGNIGWSDLMFNFSGNDYNTALNNGELFGVHFADNNDSSVGQVGVYQVNAAERVSLENSGYAHLQQYYRYGWERENTMGDIATRQAAYDYFGATTPVGTNITDGTFLGDLSFLTAAEAAEEGLDFAHFDTTSTKTHTFRFDRGLLPSGEFIASVFMECLNDGLGLRGTKEAVPEPSTMGGLIFFGLFAEKRLRRKTAKA